MLTKPKDLDYELFIFKKYEGLLAHLLARKEYRSGTTLEEDLQLLRTGGLDYMRRMAIVYRSEKKKILHSNIDLCQYVIRLLRDLIDRQIAQKGPVSLAEFTQMVKERTGLEKQPGVFKRWVHNPDHLFSEKD